MTTESPIPALARAREEFDELVRDIRPQLHRYCTRMTGSVVDAEDVVQEALAKAYYALANQQVEYLRGWLFRIAHNEAIDHLRRRKRQVVDPLVEYPLLTEEAPPLEEAEMAAVALSLFVRLAPIQRSCTILKDVMGYSLAEISEMLDVSVGAVKAGLHRGRTRLRELSSMAEEPAPLVLEGPETELLAKYVDLFNARDFDAVRNMLADDVKLDLIGRAKWRGAGQVGNYCNNYGRQEDWRFTLGFVEGRPAILVIDPQYPAADPEYFIIIEWIGGQVALIRDYRYARHVMTDAEIFTSVI